MTVAPKRIFIVPYRNRTQHKYFFSVYMSHILAADDDYEIYFSHQCDTRPFNRGATRNIGFMAMRDKYPADYKNITFIFNDVDTVPFTNIFNYDTEPGVVKHYYGFRFALGGIVVIKGGDFERIRGYPNFWGWGMEDNTLQTRCLAAGLRIDRSQFYGIGSPEIMQFFDGLKRTVTRNDPWRSKHDSGEDGLHSIRGLQYTIDAESAATADNHHRVNNPRIFYVNIRAFEPLMPCDSEPIYIYDIREPPRKLANPDARHVIDLGRNLPMTTMAPRTWSNIR